jgi:peptide deformylase
VTHDHDHHEHDHDEHDHDHGDEQSAEDERAEAEVDARRRLALAQVRQYPDSALRLVANEVTDFDDDLRRLVERMFVLMDDAQGVGLAATQVGVLRRVFVFAPDEDGPRAIVNPTIVERSTETELDEEGCLSLQGVRVPVERATTLTLEGKDELGAGVRLELDAYAARIVQHELDHLDGILIIDRTDDEHRKEALAILRPRVVLR